MKNLKKLIYFIIALVVIIALAGMYKFNYLSSQTDYDVDGNKIEEPIIQELEQQDTVSENLELTQTERELTEYICVGEFCDGSGFYDNYLERGNSFTIPVFSDGGDIGCGMKIIYAPHYTEPKTLTILDEAYKKLFRLKPSAEITEDGLVNPVGLYPHLYYKNVSIDSGLAKIYLEGSLLGPGHCSLPILREQIPALAFQFDSVQKVEVYLNNSIYDWCAMDESDGEGSCPENPDLWIDSK